MWVPATREVTSLAPSFGQWGSEPEDRNDWFLYLEERKKGEEGKGGEERERFK